MSDRADSDKRGEKVSKALILAALAVLLIAAATVAADMPAKNAILISWDGVQREHLKECLAKNHMDVWDGDIARDAPAVGPKALGYLDKFGKDRFFMFFHFSDPDHKGHTFGENSKEVNDSYITCDKWLGEIVKKLRDLVRFPESSC